MLETVLRRVCVYLRIERLKVVSITTDVIETVASRAESRSLRRLDDWGSKTVMRQQSDTNTSVAYKSLLCEARIAERISLVVRFQPGRKGDEGMMI